MALTQINFNDNLAQALIPSQFITGPVTLTGTYFDITKDQIINVKNISSVGLWLTTTPAANIDIKIKGYKVPQPASADYFADGYSVYSVRTQSGVSTFSEQNYVLPITASQNAVVQIDTDGVINYFKIFIKGSGQLLSASLTAQPEVGSQR